MNVFVTGGAGYVGSHCVRTLCDAGHDVVVFDNLSTGHRGAVDPRADLIVGDLSERAPLADLLSERSIEAVMHFAASAEVGESVRKPLFYYRNNVANTLNLLEAMRETGVRHLVFSSTCATYGVPPSVPITETMPQQPINPYGRTKLAIEWLLRDSAAAWSLGATALRYFNAAGAASDGSIGEDHDPESHLIPRVLQVALGKRDDLRIFGVDYPTPDGTCVRDYIHVEDLATVHRLVLESSTEGAFRFYNVGTGMGASVKEVIEAARAVTGHKIPAAPAPRRPGDPPQLYADPTKVRTELNWEPKYTDIRRIIETAWNWHRAHPDGFADA
ncbi:MAG: UDP-glucose 4-epimerase GalE [Planctomycetota bacterium]|nr:MAG: UDP-glucose 4-epimerase GalE [Planctomycetota bacterium]